MSNPSAAHVEPAARVLRLKRGEERRLAAGHVWVFSNEIDTGSTPLTAFAPGAVAQVRTQRTLLGATQTAVQLPGDRQLGLAAGQRRFQLLTQRPPRAEDEGLDRAR